MTAAIIIYITDYPTLIVIISINYIKSSKVTETKTLTLLQQFYIFTYIRLHSPFILNQNT